MATQQPPKVLFGPRQQVAAHRHDAQRAFEREVARPGHRELVSLDERRLNTQVIFAGVLAGTIQVIWHVL